MKNFDYFEPESVRNVLGLLAEYGEKATILAGGTDLIPRMKKGLISPSCLINIARISGLRKLEESQEGLKIGSMVPLSFLERNPLLPSRYPALQKAISHVGTPSLRNAATIGGNICLDTKCIYRDQVQTWRRALKPCFKLGGQKCYVVRGGKTCHASLAADTVPALMALGADARILSSSGERSIPVEALYTGDGVRPLVLSHGELLAEITLPSLPMSTRSTYLRFSFRKAIDIPLVSAALFMGQEDGVCVNAKIVLGAVAPKPLRLSRLEESLKGKKITPALLLECSEQAPKEALQISRSGRIDAFTRRMIIRLVYQGLAEVSKQT
jgi:4-hydroxybenzoyl-CoA reductase subunit beta